MDFGSAVKRNRPMFYRFLVVVFSVLIVLLGALMYSWGADRLTDYQWRLLETRSGERLREVELWMRQRRVDGLRFLENPGLRDDVQGLLGPGKGNTGQELLENELEFLLTHGNYDSITLLDADGVVRRHAGAGHANNGALRSAVAEAAVRRDLVFRDVRISPDEGTDVRIVMIAPVVVRDQFLGAIVFRTQPYLYGSPLVEEWPALGSSAEVLVFRIEDDTIVFLTQPRFRPIETIEASPGLLVSETVRRGGGRVEGMDYRGVPSIGYGRNIPDTPWYVVAKVDSAEASEVIQQLAVGTILISLLLLGGGVSLVRGSWRKQQAERQAAEYRAEMEKQALARHFDYLAKYANDIIILSDETGCIVEVNDRAEDAYGYSRDELRQKNISSLRVDPDAQRIQMLLAETKEKRAAVMETLHRRRDGSTFPVEISARAISTQDKTWYQEIIRDISERKRAEEALRRASAYNRNLIETSLDPLVTIAADGLITDVNAATEAVTGLPRDELIGTDFSTYFTEPDRARAGYEQAFREGSVRDYPLELRRRDGSIRSVLYNASVFRDEAGNVAGVFTAARDITERKKTEEALRASEERLALSQRVAGLGSFDWLIPEGRVVWTEGLERLYGLEPGEYRGTYEDWFSRVYPEDQATAEYSVNQAIERRDEWRAEFRIVRKDGAVRWMYALGRPIFDQAGQLVRFLGVNLDITERKQAEQAAVEQFKFAETVFTHSVSGLVVLDRDYTFLRVNEAYARQTRHEIGEFAGRNHFEMYPSDAKLIFDEVVRTKQPFTTFTREFVFPDQPERGKTYWDWTLVPVLDSEGEVEYLIFSLVEVTERKRAEEALRQTNETLKKTLEELRATQQHIIQSEKLAALGTLAAGVAHELNNPLMGVMGYVGYAEGLTQEPEARKWLERAGHELARMRDLLKNMLGFAHPIEEQTTTLRLPEVLERALALMRPDFKVRQITLATEFPPDLPPVLAKEGHLQQVFVNLLMNARDAVSGRSERRIEVRAYREGDLLKAEVADNGPGIPPEIQERIFDPFFTTKPPGQGTGLGLSISRNIMADLGGTLTVTSRAGEGPTFTVTLPLAKVADGAGN